ncbi:hypothetical protein EG329_003660 [Mollisiaceae sp. DMI_Dod_QoI]|nr:hypothetical protein EG329_003660 [Helotiales sp. DMI_Dod_QoI]
MSTNMSQSSQSNGPTFTCFVKLPLEIQIMIYNFMMPGPRHVHMTFRRALPTRLGSSTPIPALLHLNKNARYEAQKKYKLHFGSYLYEPNVYFNPDIDTLYFGPDDKELLCMAPDPGLEQRWVCHNESDSKPAYCRKGCGHHELDFFWKNIAYGCSGTLQTLGIDLRFNQSDILHFFNTLGVFKKLKKVVVYYPHRDDPRCQDAFNSNDYLFGWKMWQICGFVRTFEKEKRVALEVQQLAIPGIEADVTLELERDHESDEPTLFFQRWLKIQGLGVKGRRLISISE